MKHVALDYGRTTTQHRLPKLQGLCCECTEHAGCIRWPFKDPMALTYGKLEERTGIGQFEENGGTFANKSLRFLCFDFILI